MVEVHPEPTTVDELHVHLEELQPSGAQSAAAQQQSERERSERSRVGQFPSPGTRSQHSSKYIQSSFRHGGGRAEGPTCRVACQKSPASRVLAGHCVYVREGRSWHAAASGGRLVLTGVGLESFRRSRQAKARLGGDPGSLVLGDCSSAPLQDPCACQTQTQRVVRS